MFVIDNSVADREWDGVCATIDSVITRHGGKVVDLRKWDERRLAYQIGRAKRATYILVHFEAPTGSMQEMYKDFVLAENILRQLITVDIDGVPTGEERPGITTTLSETMSGRRGRGRRRVSAAANDKVKESGGAAAAGKAEEDEKAVETDEAEKAGEAEEGEKAVETDEPDEAEKAEERRENNQSEDGAKEES